MITVQDTSENGQNKNNIGKTDQAFNYLNAQILERKILPGQRLVERSLARECGMSKTPVREALLKLKDIGLATGDFQNGVYVINFTGQEALEIFDLREVLEGLSARLAARNANEESLNRLERLLSDSERALAAEDGKLYSELDQDFHMLLIKLGGSRRLHEIYSRLRLQAKFLMRSTMRLPGRGMKKSYREHRAVFEALKTGDEDKCEEVARLHVHNTRAALETWLRDGYLL